MQLVIGGLVPQQGLVHDFLHGLVEGGDDEGGNEGLVERFFLGISRDLRSLFVPLCDVVVDVNPEDGGIGLFSYGARGRCLPRRDCADPRGPC